MQSLYNGIKLDACQSPSTGGPNHERAVVNPVYVLSHSNRWQTPAAKAHLPMVGAHWISIFLAFSVSSSCRLIAAVLVRLYCHRAIKQENPYIEPYRETGCSPGILCCNQLPDCPARTVLSETPGTRNNVFIVDGARGTNASLATGSIVSVVRYLSLLDWFGRLIFDYQLWHYR